MSPSRAIIVLAATCIALQSAVVVADARAIDVAKDVAMNVVSTSADSVAATPEVKKEGGVRATILHTATDVALNKGMTLLEAQYPVLKVALPIAKKFAAPAINKAHEKINNMFTGNEASTTAVTSEALPSTTAKPEDENETATAEATTPQSQSGAPSEGDEKEAEEKGTDQKPGLLGKIKSLVKGEDKPAESKENKDK